MFGFGRDTGPFPTARGALLACVLLAAMFPTVGAEEVAAPAGKGDAGAAVETEAQAKTPSEDSGQPHSAQDSAPDEEATPPSDPEEEQRHSRFFDGHWRAELSGATDFPLGPTGNTGDILTFLSIEYEFPITPYGTFGLRGVPLLYYGQRGQDNVIGMGLGITARFYHVKNEYRGFFLEGEGHLLVHAERFERNDSSVNFLTGLGAGYKFKNDWHVVLKYEHISNAGLSGENAGTDTFGLGVGRSF